MYFEVKLDTGDVTALELSLLYFFFTFGFTDIHMILVQLHFNYFSYLCFSLPSGMSVGRSNIKQVADKRRADIEKFLLSLFKMAPEISQSDLVYTFFHPLLRDQQNADIHLRKVKGK